MITGFSVKNWKNLRLLEDSYKFDEKYSLIAVADGITRDPKNMPVLPDRKDVLGMLKFFYNYPRPSPAKQVADLFCSQFVGYMQDFDKKDDKAIYESFKRANDEIKKLNLKENPNPDYLENDFWACVASGTAIEEDTLSYGFIADCGVCIFNKNGDIMFKTENEGPNSKGSIDKDIRRKYNTGFRFPEGRKIIRSQYRNNSSETLAYGALTGEEEAIEYIRTGQTEFHPQDLLIVYTDGLENIIFSEEFADKVRQQDFSGIKRLCRKKVRTEGSLVLKI